MSTLDYEKFPSTADVSISSDDVNPIDGLGCMVFHKNPVGYARNGLVRRTVPGERYMRSGALYGLFEPRLLTASGSIQTLYGFSFLWSADGQNPANADAVNLYLAGFDSYGSTGAGHWGVWRYTNGFKGTRTLIFEGPSTPAVAHSEKFSLDVQWRQDDEELDGVKVILQVGTEADFSDLAPVLEVIDLSAGGALMGESFGEGPGYQNPSGGGELEFAVDRIGGDAYQGRP